MSKLVRTSDPNTFKEELLKDGGPAFPLEDETFLFSGLTARDWFAGQALAGLFGNPHFGDWIDGSRQGQATNGQTAARISYEYADAMLAERAKSEGK